LKKEKKKVTDSAAASIFYPRRRPASQDLLKSLRKIPKQKKILNQKKRCPKDKHKRREPDGMTTHIVKEIVQLDHISRTYRIQIWTSTGNLYFSFVGLDQCKRQD